MPQGSSPGGPTSHILRGRIILASRLTLRGFLKRREEVARLKPYHTDEWFHWVWKSGGGSFHQNLMFWEQRRVVIKGTQVNGCETGGMIPHSLHLPPSPATRAHPVFQFLDETEKKQKPERAPTLQITSLNPLPNHQKPSSQELKYQVVSLTHKSQERGSCAFISGHKPTAYCKRHVLGRKGQMVLSWLPTIHINTDRVTFLKFK